MLCRSAYFPDTLLKPVDLQLGYHQIHIASEDMPKTAFLDFITRLPETDIVSIGSDLLSRTVSPWWTMWNCSSSWHCSNMCSTVTWALLSERCMCWSDCFIKVNTRGCLPTHQHIMAAVLLHVCKQHTMQPIGYACKSSTWPSTTRLQQLKSDHCHCIAHECNGLAARLHNLL